MVDFDQYDNRDDRLGRLVDPDVLDEHDELI